MKNQLLAPNGNVSNLPKAQYELVRSKAFKKWFGDWENEADAASKVVDENGEPLIVYHGSNFKFNEFDKTKFKSDGFHGQGFYFAKSDLEYGDNVYHCFLNIRKPFDINADYSAEEIKFILGKKYAEIKPLIEQELEFSYNERVGGFVFYNFAGNDLLKAAGYDGLFHSSIFVAFEPNQIKLADGTNVTFDSTTNDIRFNFGGQTRKINSQDNNKMNVTEEMIENSPSGGVLIGKREGQTIIHDKGTMGGYLVGKLHKDNGIKAINKSTGEPLEMQGGEVIITAPAVSDTSKKMFEGKMMTNREILSQINADGGGVSFADGGDVPTKIHTKNKEYEIGGKCVLDTEIAHSMGYHSTVNDGKQFFTYGNFTYDVAGIQKAIEEGSVNYEIRNAQPLPMPLEIYNAKFSKELNLNPSEVNGLMVRLPDSEEDLLIDGNHRMNNAFDNNLEVIKVYYVSEPEEIAQFVKINPTTVVAELANGGKVGVNNPKSKKKKTDEISAEDQGDFVEVIEMQQEFGDSSSDADLAFEDGGITAQIEASNTDDLMAMLDTPRFSAGGTLGVVGNIDGIVVERIFIIQDLTLKQLYRDFLNKEYTSFQDLKKDLEVAFDEFRKTSPANGGFVFNVNEISKSSPSLFFYFSHKKNTVLNFNPNTGKASDLVKQLQRKKKITFNKLNWTKFFDDSQKGTSSSSIRNTPISGVKSVTIEYKASSSPNGKRNIQAKNLNSIIENLTQIFFGNDKKDTFVGIEVVGEDNSRHEETIVLSQNMSDAINPLNLSQPALRQHLEDHWFPEYDWNSFFNSGSSSKTTTSANQQIAQFMGVNPSGASNNPPKNLPHVEYMNVYYKSNGKNVKSKIEPSTYKSMLPSLAMLFKSKQERIEVTLEVFASSESRRFTIQLMTTATSPMRGRIDPAFTPQSEFDKYLTEMWFPEFDWTEFMGGTSSTAINPVLDYITVRYTDANGIVRLAEQKSEMDLHKFLAGIYIDNNSKATDVILIAYAKKPNSKRKEIDLSLTGSLKITNLYQITPTVITGEDFKKQLANWFEDFDLKDFFVNPNASLSTNGKKPVYSIDFEFNQPVYNVQQLIDSLDAQAEDHDESHVYVNQDKSKLGIVKLKNNPSTTIKGYLRTWKENEKEIYLKLKLKQLFSDYDWETFFDQGAILPKIEKINMVLGGNDNESFTDSHQMLETIKKLNKTYPNTKVDLFYVSDKGMSSAIKINLEDLAPLNQPLFEKSLMQLNRTEYDWTDFFKNPATFKPELLQITLSYSLGKRNQEALFITPIELLERLKSIFKKQKKLDFPIMLRAISPSKQNERQFLLTNVPTHETDIDPLFISEAGFKEKLQTWFPEFSFDKFFSSNANIATPSTSSTEKVTIVAIEFHDIISGTSQTMKFDNGVRLLSQIDSLYASNKPPFTVELMPFTNEGRESSQTILLVDEPKNVDEINPTQTNYGQFQSKMHLFFPQFDFSDFWDKKTSVNKKDVEKIGFTMYPNATTVDELIESLDMQAQIQTNTELFVNFDIKGKKLIEFTTNPIAGKLELYNKNWNKEIKKSRLITTLSSFYPDYDWTGFFNKPLLAFKQKVVSLHVEINPNNSYIPVHSLYNLVITLDSLTEFRSGAGFYINTNKSDLISFQFTSPKEKNFYSKDDTTENKLDIVKSIIKSSPVFGNYNWEDFLNQGAGKNTDNLVSKLGMSYYDMEEKQVIVTLSDNITDFISKIKRIKKVATVVEITVYRPPSELIEKNFQLDDSTTPTLPVLNPENKSDTWFEQFLQENFPSELDWTKFFLQSVVVNTSISKAKAEWVLFKYKDADANEHFKRITDSKSLLSYVQLGQKEKYRDAGIFVNQFPTAKIDTDGTWLFLDDEPKTSVYKFTEMQQSEFDNLLTQWFPDFDWSTFNKSVSTGHAKENVEKVFFKRTKVDGTQVTTEIKDSEKLYETVTEMAKLGAKNASLMVNSNVPSSKNKNVAPLFFEDELYPYTTMSLDEMEEIITDVFFPNYDWTIFFKKPRIAEHMTTDFPSAIAKLEKKSAIVAKEFNSSVNDLSLQFLYETKQSYEMALTITPESAFMYERIDILKKLAMIEKSIKNIEDLKKGGSYFILAQILAKLQQGENWTATAENDKVLSNAIGIPQSEIDVIIRSQKFINWFGDWEKALSSDEYDNVSKALTNGMPAVYYHGARRIKYSYREVSNGVMYLAQNKSYALWFSENSTAQHEQGSYLTECFANLRNPIDLTAFHVREVDLGDLVTYIDIKYPLANIYNFIPKNIAEKIRNFEPTNLRMWAWQLIRRYANFLKYVKESTPYDGFIFYENNPDDPILNPTTGQYEENVTKAVAIFKSHQVKVVDAILFDGGLDDWRFEKGGKLENKKQEKQWTYFTTNSGLQGKYKIDNLETIDLKDYREVCAATEIKLVSKVGKTHYYSALNELGEYFDTQIFPDLAPLKAIFNTEDKQ